MSLQSLISEIVAEFPDALTSEIGEALILNPQTVSRIVRSSGVPARDFKFARKKDSKVVKHIEAFARSLVGGEIEVVAHPGKPALLCVNGQVVERDFRRAA